MTTAIQGMPVARASDPDESWQAAESISRQAQKASQREVLRELAYRGPQIAQQLEEHLARRLSPSRVRTALTELERDGLARRTGRTRPTVSGRMAAVWEATPRDTGEEI